MRARRATVIAVASLLLVAGQVVPAVAVADGLTTASAGGTKVAVSIPDVIFEGPECMKAPVKAAFDQVDSFATVHLAAAIEGSNNSLSMSLLANASGPLTDTFQVCPSIDVPGTYNVSGTLNTAVEAANFTPSAFTVSRAPTQFSVLAASVRGGVLTVAGKVVARTAPSGSTATCRRPEGARASGRPSARPSRTSSARSGCQAPPIVASTAPSSGRSSCPTPGAWPVAASSASPDRVPVRRSAGCQPRRCTTGVDGAIP
jgi:hypothetical protein